MAARALVSCLRPVWPHAFRPPVNPLAQGWSLGGMVATAMAALYGPQVGSVVVAAGSAGSRNSFAPAPDVLELSIRQNISALEGATVLFDLSTAQGARAVRAEPAGKGRMLFV